MHLPAIIHDLAIILATAAVTTVIFRAIRQPVVLGYIIAGLIVGPFTPPFPLINDIPNIRALAELGVIFLMFSLGLEFSFRRLMRVGSAAAATALFEVLGMVLIGYLAGRLLGWGERDSLFLGGMLAISSTTIIIKAFEEQGLTTRRFAELVFGVLIVEDLFAILLLVGLPLLTAARGAGSLGPELVSAGSRLVVVIGSWILAGYLVIPSALRWTRKWMSAETLTVSSLGLCLLLVVLAARFEYSPALGAFVMGSILAESDEAHRIEQLIRPIRDLFAAVFFVSVGMLVDPGSLHGHWGVLGIITVVTVVGKLLITSLGALASGQPLKQSIQIGFSLAQIGEFSFIIATLGLTLGLTSDFLFPIGVGVSVFTTFLTPYLIRLSEPAASFLSTRLPTRVTTMLDRYATWAQQPRQRSDSRRGLLQGAVRLALNGIVVTAIFFVLSRRGITWITDTFSGIPYPNLIAWLAALLFSAPFVWGMLTSFYRRQPVGGQSAPSTGAAWALVGQVASLGWLAGLTEAFFSTGSTVLLTLLALLGFMVLFYRRLESSYGWFERRLVTNVSGKGASDPQHRLLRQLAPWDLHLVRVRVSPDSPLVAKTLVQAEVRNKFGLNVVAIQRGDKLIAPPTATDLLLPGDELLTLGTDDQIERFRVAATPPRAAPEHLQDLSRYRLQQLLVEPTSPLVDRAIRDSGLREKARALVVGLERGEIRHLNPDPETVMRAGDVLWVVMDA